jgi:hypothetical protein
LTCQTPLWASCGFNGPQAAQVLFYEKLINQSKLGCNELSILIVSVKNGTECKCGSYIANFEAWTALDDMLLKSTLC